MKTHFILLLIFCFAFVACSVKEESIKGSFDIKGKIVEINDKEYRILVEDKDKGQTWVTLHENGNIKNYEEGQEVVIWVDGGIDTSSPASAKALNIEFSTPKQ